MMKMMRVAVFVFLFLGVAAGAARAGWDPKDDEKAQQAVDYIKKNAPALDRFFVHAYGFAVFPDIYKGGLFLLGGAHGQGYVYELNTLVGESTVTQVNVGPQLGGQSFSEIIFFKSKADLDNFKKGNFELTAQATAILIKSGMATNTDYSNGVAVFALPKAGLMADLTVGGQKFSYRSR
ncbi:lipid-binding SYLF domain-containing protein [Chlorobium phaeobacteroides]|jgi:lipid-binding SYLF domain-containing protein|uniref:Ysc84 actin-binding domain-containing protein n=1 Tax=Chlorobium phaeobacteroides (strain DSM 266 / SMG 266 / 2430) TaxID=290317 RepID=A1BJ59_CHLPD|nr:lipid-binding SYLF domain-containing protein [Chlorobium phaeobacteroides]ABL66436.1 conserved hypothetical protein [Chlorobium phaeobacteroides DSM 266]MBV5319537.1 lipid-binding SYLF domain-containing protein [Chlorobium phaeobacteroides]